MRGAGVLRVLAVVVAGAAAVAGATAMDRTYLVDGAPHRTAPAAGQPGRPLTAVSLLCPGPETTGVPGLPRPRAGGPGAAVDLIAAAAPAGVPGALGAELPDGSIRLVALPGDVELRRTTVGTSVPAAPVTGARGGLVAASGGLAPTLAGLQRSLVPAGERRALTSAPCSVPQADAWLLAGSGQAGRQEHLVLVNPHGTAATVDVTVLGTRGPIIGVAGRGVVVPARGRTVVLLDALDGAEVSPAAHVQVRAGTVHATLHDGWLDGIVPRGGDDAAASAPPETLQVLPGVSVSGPADPVVVRVAVPGTAPSDVRVSVLGPSGPVPGAIVTRRVAGRATADLGLPSLPSGVYAVQVQGSTPVVAAASVGRADGARPAGPATVAAPVRDLAWAVAASPLHDLAGVPLGVQAGVALDERLSVANPTSRPATATLTLVDPAGLPSPRLLTVPAASAVSVAVGGSASVWLRPDVPGVRAALVTEAEGGLITSSPLTARPQTTVPFVVSRQG
ncbi:DUF5719 family protein [Arsenicicoccus dermatophilus]|uniref:DUF5719 family protein n=1 Tax=Arsenicicoccus dermatophilus TaxID=1076331 RepID=UPI003916F712